MVKIKLMCEWRNTQLSMVLKKLLCDCLWLNHTSFPWIPGFNGNDRDWFVIESHPSIHTDSSWFVCDVKTPVSRDDKSWLVSDVTIWINYRASRWGGGAWIFCHPVTWRIYRFLRHQYQFIIHYHSSLCSTLNEGHTKSYNKLYLLVICHLCFTTSARPMSPPLKTIW
jgi:hypothetical protein